MSKTTALYHIVFSTYCRAFTIDDNDKEHLYRYIWRILEDNNCKLIRIGGIANHIHMLINLSSSVALGVLMQKIKGASSKWIKESEYFPKFTGWSRGYFASSLSWADRISIINYIKSQPEHHKSVSFDKELITIAGENGIELYAGDFQ